jgi:ATPase subunit of ABC transporter with duplicated ATPase domains
MINVTDISLQFADQLLFKDVNVRFFSDNCYGIIGANGSGKSTFLKILSGEVEPNKGNISMPSDERMAVLEQDHFKYDDFTVMETVLMGHKRLYEIMEEKDALYSKEDFTEADGLKAAELEGEFEELDGWDAEMNAEKILMGLGIEKELHELKMSELQGGGKVKVLLGKALFGEPDNLLLDEPTNHLDFQAITWLEDFLMDYHKTVLVVSHDRHFLNKVCTHIVDIDFSKVKLFVGNYDFWEESSALALKLMKNENQKKEEKIKELQAFIARFSSNASKAKQATSRKKLLDKIELDDLQPSSRKYPFVGFTPKREAGNEVLSVEGISKTIDGEKILDNVSFIVNKADKIILLSRNELARTTLLKILMGEMEPDEGTFKWGVTITKSYLPKENTSYFENSEYNLIDWLRQYSPDQRDQTFIRGFLGKMLFSGEEALKNVSVLSGGEKMRCMFSRLMLSGGNVLILDEPTNHLDLESIKAVNDGLIAFKGTLLLTSHDHQFIETIANRVIEITPSGLFDKVIDFDEFLADAAMQQEIKNMY